MPPAAPVLEGVSDGAPAMAHGELTQLAASSHRVQRAVSQKDRIQGGASARRAAHWQQMADRGPRGRASAVLQAMVSNSPGALAPTRRVAGDAGGQAAGGEHTAGLPGDLRAGIERMSGLSMDDVRVHYNSPKPAQLRALAYTQGTEIHVAPGQARHLPHEAWHVVQQKQGRVAPATRAEKTELEAATGVAINDDSGLEREADVMGGLAARRGAPAPGTTGSGEAAHRPLPASGGRQPIQRLVGFECELAVPSLGPVPAGAADRMNLAKDPAGNDPTAAVQQFLLGGLKYGVNLGENNNFRLTTDHDELQSRMIDLWTQLAGMGMMKQVVKGDINNTSNLEYVTPPLDELAAGSTARFNAQFAAITNHVNALFPNLQNALIPIGAPARNPYHTGVPLVDLQTWLGGRFHQIQPQLAAFQGAIRNRLYLQATAGIIPSAIRDLHRTIVPPNYVNASAMLKPLWAVEQTINALDADPTFQGFEYIRAMRQGTRHRSGILGISFTTGSHPQPIDYEAFMGILYLIFMYMVGSALNQTSLFDGVSSKNAVPFMSKMKNMRTIVTSAAPKLNKHRPPREVIDFVQDHFSNSNYVDVDWWITDSITWNTMLWDRRTTLFGGEKRDPIINATFVSDMLRAKRRWWPFEPKVRAAGSPRSLKSPDPLPEDVRRDSRQQRGAQFEYRRIAARPAAGQLGPALLQVVNEVRQLNTKHMTVAARTALLAAT